MSERHEPAPQARERDLNRALDELGRIATQMATAIGAVRELLLESFGAEDEPRPVPTRHAQAPKAPAVGARAPHPTRQTRDEGAPAPAEEGRSAQTPGLGAEIVWSGGTSALAGGRTYASQPQASRSAASITAPARERARQPRDDEQRLETAQLIAAGLALGGRSEEEIATRLSSTLDPDEVETVLDAVFE